jgi:hypothetical protein
MREVWSDRRRFELWLQVEVLACEAWAELGRIPVEALPKIRAASFDVDRIRSVEERVGHDMIAFLTVVNESVGMPEARYIPTITELFQQHLVPVAGLMDAELRACAGTLSQKEAAGQLRTLVAACRQLEEDLDQPTANPVTLTWPAPVAFA